MRFRWPFKRNPGGTEVGWFGLVRTPGRPDAIVGGAGAYVDTNRQQPAEGNKAAPSRPGGERSAA